MSTHPLDLLEPADQPLLDLVFDQVDDAMLLEIARYDYGDDVEIHLAALYQIRANNIPRPLQWHPGEVLNLTKYRELDNIAQDRAILNRNHWMRLFACTVLIWASLEPENHEDQDYWYYLDGEDSTIIQFLDSALYLGNDVLIAALKFLGWRMKSQIEIALIHEDFGNCPCYAVAMLLLCVSLFGEDSPLTNRCSSEIVSFLISIAYCNHEYIPISREIDCQRSQKWRDTIQKILLDPMTASFAQLGKIDDWRSNPDFQRLVTELMGGACDLWLTS